MRCGDVYGFLMSSVLSFPHLSRTLAAAHRRNTSKPGKTKTENDNGGSDQSLILPVAPASGMGFVPVGLHCCHRGGLQAVLPSAIQVPRAQASGLMSSAATSSRVELGVTLS